MLSCCGVTNQSNFNGTFPEFINRAASAFTGDAQPLSVSAWSPVEWLGGGAWQRHMRRGGGGA
jgi:hypothetical protein